MEVAGRCWPALEDVPAFCEGCKSAHEPMPTIPQLSTNMYSNMSTHLSPCVNHLHWKGNPKDFTKVVNLSTQILKNLLSSLQLADRV